MERTGIDGINRILESIKKENAKLYYMAPDLWTVIIKAISTCETRLEEEALTD